MATTGIGIKLSLDGVQQTESGLRRVASGVEQLGISASGVRNAIGGLTGALAGVVSVRAFVQAADAVTQLQNQLRLATGSARQATEAYGALFEIAQRSRVSFTELGGTFASIARASDSLGLSQQQLLQLTETIGNAVTISGGSAQAAQAALTQLSQGLASGVLRGEELNSVMEQTPRLARALADGLNIPIGKLRELGQEGQLTAQKVIEALRSQSGTLASEVASSTVTVSQAFTVLQNAATVAAGQLDTATGASQSLAKALQGTASAVTTLGEAIESNADTIKTTLGAVAGAATAAGLLVVAANIGRVRTAFLALTAAMASNPITLALLGIGAAAGALYVDSQVNRYENLSKELTLVNQALERGNLTDQRRNMLVQKRIELEKQLAEFLTSQAGAGRGSVNPDTVKVAAVAGPDDAAGKALKEMRDAFADQVARDYVKGLEDFARVAGDAQAKAEGLSKTQARLREIQADPSWAAFSRQQQEQIIYAAALAQAREDQADATEALKKSQEDSRRIMEDYARAEQDVVADAIRAAGAAEEQLRTYGLLKSQIEELKLAKLEEARISMAAAGEELEAIDARIAAQKRLIAATQGLEAKEAAAKGAQEAAEAWEKTADQIGDALTNALMRGFEDGKGFADNFKATLVNMFKTMVLRPVIQAVLSPVSGGISSILGGTGNAAGGNILSLVNGASSASNLYNLASTGYSATVGNAVGSVLGQSAGNAALATAVTGDAASASAASLAAAQAGGTATAASGTLASMGSSVAAAMPYVAAALAIMAVAQATKGETRGGGYYTADATGATSFVRGPSGGELAADQVKSAISGTVSGLNRLFADMGSTAMVIGFQAGLETSGKGRGGVLAGGTLASGATFGENGTGSNYDGTFFEAYSTQSPDAATALANFTTDLKQATLQALQAATDIPQAIADKLKGVDVESLTDGATTQLLTAIEQQVSAVGQLRTAVADLPFADLAQWSFDATAKLIDLAGGLEALSSSLTTYYDNFYSAAEKADLVTQRLTKEFDKLGLALPADRLAYRAQVEAAIADGNEELVASLLRLSSAFASVTDSVTEAAEAARAATATAADAAVAAVSGLGPTPEQLLSAAKDATDRAFETLKRSIDAQRKLAETARELAAENVKAITGVFDLLKDQIAQLRGESGTGMTAAQGRDFIAQAISTARSTGYLPEQDQLASAIAAVRSGLTSDNYSTSQALRRDQLALAGSLEELQMLTGDQLDSAQTQLSLAEAQLSTLDGVLATAQSQLDALRGIDNSVMSVEDAIRNLNLAMGTEQAAAAVVANKQSYFDRYPDVAAAYANRFTDPNLASTINLSEDQFAALHYQLYGRDEQRIAPGFATGGLHAGGLRIVGENGPELELTGPSRIFNATQTANLLYGGQEVAGEVRALREDNRAQARAMAELQARMTRLLERWDGDGMPETRAVTA